MAGIIQHNIPAMNAYANYAANTKALSSNLEKLSSAYKINRAGDDAAGLAISEKMRAQISGLETAQKNAKDGISLVQTAEGALTEVHSMLNRMVTLAEQSANGTYSNEVDREQIQKEIDQLSSEINRIADSSNFNGIKLLDGSLDGSSTKTTAAEWSFDTHVIDATKAKQEIAFGTAEGTGKIEDGGVIKLNLGLSDGTSMEIALTASVTEGTTTGTGKLTLTDQDGNEVLSLDNIAAANGYTAATKEVLFDDGTASDFDEDALMGAITEALKKSDLGDSYRFAINGTTPTNIDMTARKDGADTVTITSIRETYTKANGDDDTATLFEAGSLVIGTDPGDVASIVSTKLGTDAVTTFLSDDIVLYDDSIDNGDGTYGNAKDAVFTINGQKFAIGVASQGNGASGVTHLDDDVTYISLEALQQSSGIARDPAVAASGDAATATIGISLKDKDGKVVDFTEDSLYQITNEISEKLGVNVNYQKATVTTAPNSDETEDGESIITNAVGNYQNQGFFTVEDSVTDGGPGKALTLQIGDTAESFNQLRVSIKDMHTESMGIGDIDVSTQEGAAAAMDKIKAAINYVSDVRGDLGATQNRLDHTINNLTVMQTNIQDAESAIRDTDVAAMMMEYTKNNIKVQAAQAMLAQANQLPQGVLQMIG